MFYPPFIADETKRFSFKSGCIIRVENGKMHCQLKPKKAKVLCVYIAAKDVLATLY